MSGLAIVVPYKDRENYLEVFLGHVPKYLRASGISDYAIYVSEQASSDTFNHSVSHNIAAKAALDDGASYFVFHNVDVIPVSGVDYGPRNFNTVWFLDAGSCKVIASDFVRANGYNPDFVGWGDDDTEFYHRLWYTGSDVRYWHMLPESKGAVVLNLEMPQMTDDDAMSWSRGYFGHDGSGPRFVPYRGNLDRHDKSRNFEWQQRNHVLWESIYRMPPAERSLCFARSGLNRVSLDRAARGISGRIRWIKYRTDDVLDQAA